MEYGRRLRPGTDDPNSWQSHPSQMPVSPTKGSRERVGDLVSVESALSRLVRRLPVYCPKWANPLTRRPECDLMIKSLHVGLQRGNARKNWKDRLLYECDSNCARFVNAFWRRRRLLLRRSGTWWRNRRSTTRRSYRMAFDGETGLRG